MPSIRGDDEIAEFCRSTYPRLVGALTLHTGERPVAEEIAQEALARLWSRWSSVAPAARRVWVFRVALNLSHSRWRRIRRERATFRAVARDEGRLDPDIATDVTLRQALVELPPRQRSAIVLRFYCYMSVADTATAMGCAAGTVKALTSQGLANLRKTLDDDLEAFDGEPA